MQPGSCRQAYKMNRKKFEKSTVQCNVISDCVFSLHLIGEFIWKAMIIRSGVKRRQRKVNRSHLNWMSHMKCTFPWKLKPNLTKNRRKKSSINRNINKPNRMCVCVCVCVPHSLCESFFIWSRQSMAINMNQHGIVGILTQKSNQVSH